MALSFLALSKNIKKEKFMASLFILKTSKKTTKNISENKIIVVHKCNHDKKKVGEIMVIKRP